MCIEVTVRPLTISYAAPLSVAGSRFHVPLQAYAIVQAVSDVLPVIWQEMVK